MASSRCIQKLRLYLKQPVSAFCPEMVTALRLVALFRCPVRVFLQGLIACLLFWMGTVASVCATTVELRDATVTTFVSGVTTQSSTLLPYSWDHLHRGKSGTATFDIFFSLPSMEGGQAFDGPAERYEVYFSRLGTAYEVSLNGNLLEYFIFQYSSCSKVLMIQGISYSIHLSMQIYLPCICITI